MIELITGTPGSFKTATAVLLCAKVPGSFVEAAESLNSHGVQYAKGDQVPRHLFTNIKGLLVEHQFVDDEAMRTWHLWAQAGDVIVFDEAQTLWRQRSVQNKVPDEVAAMETHRHMGVDLVLVTQGPMLIDANIRRLVNKHTHLRRLPGGMVMHYEWDHCGQPGSYKTCVSTGLQRAPRKAFPLYRSATLHTRPKTSMPVGLLAVLAIAVGVSAWQGPQVYDRIFRTATAQPVAKTEPKPMPLAPATVPTPGAVVALPPALPASAPASAAAPAVRLAGCMAVKSACSCFDESGQVVKVEESICLSRLPQGGKPIDLVSLAPELRQPVADLEQQRRDLDVWRSLQEARVIQSREVGLRLNGQTPATVPSRLTAEQATAVAGNR